MSHASVIGIDLGTVYCRVSIWCNGHIEVIEDAHSHRSMASCVSFTDTQRLVGNPAQERAKSNSANTIYNALRLVSRKYDDPDVQRMISQMPFKVVNDKNRPMLRVEHKQRNIMPLEIIAMLLSKLKKQAEAHLGKGVRIRDAVIVIPATFSNTQRQAMIDAAAIAGLRVQRFISGSTAATLAYAFNRNSKNRSTRGDASNLRREGRSYSNGGFTPSADDDGSHIVLAYDFGGGSVDVTLSELQENSVVEVKAITGTASLGGRDLDELLLDYLIRDINRRYGRDIHLNLRAKARLREACERTKRILSTIQSTRVEVDGLAEGLDYYEKTITRTELEKICGDKIRSSLRYVEEVLRDAKIKKEDVHEYILVGGTSRMPLVTNMVRDFFGNTSKEPNKTVDADEAAVYGAGIQAAIISAAVAEQMGELLLMDAVPISLGIETTNGVMAVLIKRNATMPTRRSETYTTFVDNQPGIIVSIFEGEHGQVAGNNLLGKFELMGIPPVPKGVPKIEVTLQVNALGILDVSAKELSTNNVMGITVTGKDRLSIEEVDKLKHEAKLFDEAEAAAEACTGARNALEGYALHLQSSLDQLYSDVSHTLSWLDQAGETVKKEAFENAKESLQASVRTVLNMEY